MKLVKGEKTNTACPPPHPPAARHPYTHTYSMSTTLVEKSDFPDIEINHFGTAALPHSVFEKCLHNFCGGRDISKSKYLMEHSST